MYSKGKSDLEDKEEFKIIGLDSERFSDELFCTKCGCKGYIVTIQDGGIFLPGFAGQESSEVLPM